MILYIVVEISEEENHIVKVRGGDSNEFLSFAIKLFSMMMLQKLPFERECRQN